jgi:hypothetical protein
MRILHATREARAPKLLHVGRRPARRAQTQAGDPGSKSWREAQKTTLALALGVTYAPTGPAELCLLRRSPAEGMDGEARVSAAPNLPDRLMAGHHALNVAIEVQVLVPDSGSGRVAQRESARLTCERLLVRAQPRPLDSWRIAQEGERLSDPEEAAGSTPAPPTLIAHGGESADADTPPREEQ